MNGPWSSRFLWASLLALPLLLLAVAGVVSAWPQQVLGLANQLTQLVSSEPAPRRPRPPAPPEQPLSPPPVPSAMIRGLIRRPDGSLHEGRYSLDVVYVRTHNRFGSGFRGVGRSAALPSAIQSGPDFSIPVEGNLIWAVISAPDHAAELVGPISDEDLKPDAAPVEVVLKEGFSHRVRVVDAGGAPIPLAVVRASLTLTPPFRRPRSREPGTDTYASPTLATVTTDEDGFAVFPHVQEIDYEFSATVYACMFPDDTVFVRPSPGVDTVIQLPRSATQGVVVHDDGRPAADAVLTITSEFDERNGHESSHVAERIVASKTDAEGRFRLPNLHRDSAYLIRAEGVDGSRGYASGVHASDSEVKIDLLRRRIVRGMIDPSRHAQVAIQYMISSGFEYSRHDVPQEPVVRWTQFLTPGPDGRFEFPAWDQSQVELTIGDRAEAFPWPPPAKSLVFTSPERSEPTERTVRVQMEVEGTDRSIDGTITIYLVNGPPERALQTVPRLVEIRNGTATFSCLQSESFRYDASAVPGYWTVPGTIPPSIVGSPPLKVGIRLFPARPIQGRVVEADGTPVAGVNVEAVPPPEKVVPPPEEPRRRADVVDAPSRGPDAIPTPSPWKLPERNAEFVRDHDAQLRTSTTTNSEGRFMITAWPVAIPYRLVATRGRSETVFTPAPAATVGEGPEIKIEIPRTTTAAIRLIDPDGLPISNVPLQVRLIRGDESRVWPAAATADDGRAVIDGLAEGEPGYDLTIAFPKDYQRLVAPLKPGGPLLELKAERGRLIEGRLTEAVTGWPIPNVRVFAASKATGMIDADAPSDDDGRFRISTVPEGTYELHDEIGGARERLSSPWPVAVAGSGRLVEIRAFDLKELDPRSRPPVPH